MSQELKRTLFVIAWVFAAGCAALAAAPIVWVVPNSLLRVYPTDPPGSGTAVTIYCARGEYCAFQVAVQAPAGGLTKVNFSASSLTGPGGATIPSSDLIAYREQYITVQQHSPTNSGGGPPNLPITNQNTFPDPLVPFIDPATGMPPTSGATYTPKLASLAAGSNAMFWVDTLVPRGTTAGLFAGTYTVTSDQASVTGSINVNVWNFTLPLKPSLHSNFNGGGTVVAGGNVELLRNKLMPDYEPVSNEAGDIANYGYNTVELSGLYSGFYSGVYYAHCRMKSPPSISSIQSAVAAQQPGLYITDYSADPESSCTKSTYYNAMVQWGYNLHQGGSNNLVSQQPVTQLFNDGTGRTAVDDWAMLPMDYNAASPSNISYVMSQPGNEIWSYNDLVQDTYSPKWELDFPPIQYRIQPGFISQSLGLKGLNYWSIDNWSSSPWTNPNGSQNSAYPGEGQLVYPGANAGLQGVAPSMRLKYLRDGVQDYEYVQLLRNCGQSSLALSVANSVGKDWNWGDWTTDPNALESAREQLGNQISASSCAP
jgi:Domain of unknown function (DUF4091)